MTPGFVSVLLLLALLNPAVQGQQSHILRHTYKVRLHTTQNALQRGMITAATDSTLTILWHGSETLYHYSEIKKITVFRKGTVGKWMLVTVPLSIAGGLMIADNQSSNRIEDSLNGIAAFEIGLMAGIAEAAAIASLKRKRYSINRSPDRFKAVLACIRR